jgi:hypothetical protein
LQATHLFIPTIYKEIILFKPNYSYEKRQKELAKKKKKEEKRLKKLEKKKESPEEYTTEEFNGEAGNETLPKE